jgi:geranylgeranyl diphosphate synthase type I
MDAAPAITRQIPRLHNEFERFLERFLAEHAARASYGNGLTPFYDDLREYIGRRAKRIRPLLFLLSHHIFDPHPAPGSTALMQTAAAIELFHSFILIHDDIIDRSDRRRGLPTLHRLLESHFAAAKDRDTRGRLGVNTSLVFGDVLFALATQTFLEADFPAERKQRALAAFLRYVSDTGRGEIYEIIFSARDVRRVKESEIRKTYALKTTKYTFECPLVIGAILAGAPKAAVQALVQFSRPVGLAFQIQNDLNEFRDVRASGKEIIEDLFEGKKTLLLRKAYDKLGRADRLFLQTCFDAKRLTDAAVHRISDLVMASGAFAELEAEVERLFAEAVAVIHRAYLKPAQQEQVLAVLDYLKRTTLTNAPVK